MAGAMVIVLVVGLLVVGGINAWILSSGRSMIVDASEARHAQAAMVLGALVSDDMPSTVLADRLEAAFALYRDGKVDKLLLTGDHGRTDYDEVNVMRTFMLRKGARPEDIFMDHAGFTTYNSMYRARDVFEVRSMIVVTQAFHLPRALWIARRLGLDVQGVVADRRLYADRVSDRVRECGARVKAFASVTFQAKPVFLGPVIPITGDGHATWD